MLTKDTKFIVAFGLFLFLAIMVVNYSDASLRTDDDHPYLVPQTSINSSFGDASFRMKSLSDPEFIEYAFDFEEKDIAYFGGIDHLFLLVGYLDVQAYEVYLNETYIGGAGDFTNGTSDVSKVSYAYALPKELIDSSNHIEIKTRSLLNTGFRGQVQIVSDVGRNNFAAFRSFDFGLTAFVVFGTLLLAIALIYLSIIYIRVRDDVLGNAYLYLSIAVVFLSVHSMGLLGETYFFIPFTWAYKLNKFLILGAAFSLSMATGFWKYSISRRFFGPLLFSASIGVILMTPQLIVYEWVMRLIMVFYIGMNMTSLYFVIRKSQHDKEVQLAKSILMTILLSLVIRFLPSFIYENIVLDLSSIGIVPLCMFWFLVTYSMIKEMLVARTRELLEADKLKMQQVHVFNNMGEGFFRVGQDGKVVQVLTQVCNDIFGKDILGLGLSELLGTEDEDIEFLDELLSNFFNKKIAGIVCFELFPEEIKVGNKYFSLSYEPEKKGDDYSALVVVMSDITEAKAFEEKSARERDKLKMVVSTMLNRDDLIELLNEFLEFTSDVEEDSFNQIELMNKIHTFKGNFGMYNLMNIVPYLHDLEDDLLAGGRLESHIGNEMRNTIYEDLETVTEMTGSSFFEDEVYLTVNRHNLEKVYQQVRKYFYDQEASLILNIMEQIFYKSVGDILMLYAKESVKTASRKGKTINIATISGDQVFIDTVIYKDVFRSFIHIFNNCIEHGIEDEEERMMFGKSPYGELACGVDDLGNLFEISITDDGRGLDVGKIRSKAIYKGIITEDQADQMTEEDLKHLIFEPNFSTKSYADDISGRGVGMAAVKAEVEKIGGSVRVDSVMDFGTTVKILLPKPQARFVKFFSIPILLDLYVESCKIYLKSNFVLDLPLSVSGINRGIEPLDLAVIIPFKGPEEGAFYFSANRKLIRGLARAMMELSLMEDVTDEMYEETKIEVLKESCNIIAGNAISLFDTEGSVADIGVPLIIEDVESLEEYISLTWSLEYDRARFCLGILQGYQGEVIDMEDILNS